MIRLVDVLMGGPGREAAVSRVSGSAVADALAEKGIDVARVEVGERLDPTSLRDDAIVFNLIHGTYGEDGTLQSELDAANRRYVGSGAAASRLCIDKDATRRRLQSEDLPVPWGATVDPRDPGAVRDFRTPTLTGLVVKPVTEGSSVGLRLLPSRSFLLPAVEELVAEIGPTRLLIEERLPGPEYTVAVLEDAGGEPRALPPLRIVPTDSETYDYHAKYDSDETRYEFPDDPGLCERLRVLGLAAHRACGCRHLSRVDLMADRDGELRILEINTLPGFTSHSLVPKVAERAGIGFADLALRLADLAGGSGP